MTDTDLTAMVLHRSWLACPAPGSGRTDRLAFDLDCKATDGGEQQRARYWMLRRLMGIERIPLVFRTPSGAGLRVVYRIPSMPLAQLVTSVSTGLVADACRAAGLPVKPGQLEIFPQRTKVDRLPLGRRMAMLDPETLEPLAHANIGDDFDLPMLEGAVVEMERWYARAYDDLLSHLRAQLSVGSTGTRSSESRRAAPRLMSRAASSAPSPVTTALITTGLTAPSTRYGAEFEVGLAALEHPALLGLTPPLSDVMVAEAIADWLARGNNGYSREWADSVRRFGTNARQWWVQRYLHRDAATGKHMIDRLEAALASRCPEMRRTSMITPAERDVLMALAADVTAPDAQRYRAECWLVAWFRAVRSIMAYHERRGHPPAPSTLGGVPAVEIEICTRWMRRWPFGEGRNSATRIPRYMEYRDMLLGAGLMELACAAPEPMRFAKVPSHGRNLPQVAHRYRVVRPASPVRVRDVGVTHAQLSAIRCSLPCQYGRVPSVDELHHVLLLRRWGIDLRARYGERTAQWVTQFGSAIENGLARLDVGGR